MQTRVFFDASVGIVLESPEKTVTIRQVSAARRELDHIKNDDGIEFFHRVFVADLLQDAINRMIREISVINFSESK